MLRGRLQGQAPEIDPLVYLTDCDPSTVRAGDFIDVEIVGAQAITIADRCRRPLHGRRLAGATEERGRADTTEGAGREPARRRAGLPARDASPSRSGPQPASGACSPC